MDAALVQTGVVMWLLGLLLPLFNYLLFLRKIMLQLLSNFLDSAIEMVNPTDYQIVLLVNCDTLFLQVVFYSLNSYDSKLKGCRGKKNKQKTYYIIIIIVPK